MPAAALGTSVGSGVVVYQIARVADGLARMELGRSKFRHSSSPSFLYGALSSLRWLAIVEIPLFINMGAVMGLSQYDSDGDDETDTRKVYCMDWKPEVSGLHNIRANVSTCCVD